MPWHSTIRIKNILFVFILMFILDISTSEANEPCKTDTGGKIFPGATWKIAATPEQLGWSSGKLKNAEVFSDKIGTAAVLIVDNGIIVDQWGGVSLKYPIHSIRKPLLSALVGIHVKEGHIDLSNTLEKLGIDDIKPYLTKTEKQATITDLLKSCSGVYHTAIGEVEIMKQVRPERGSHAPGSFWYYNNWDFNAMGTIFEQETGTRIFEEFASRIAGPLQMEDFSISNGKYINGTGSIHRVYAFRMSARDLARFGLLYLRRGKWKDEQIVSSNWVQKSTATHTDIGLGRGYGYMWKTAVKGGLAPNVQLRKHCYFHSGAMLHYLVVIPYRNLVIVHRVNTDSDGLYPQYHQIGRLFWMILDAAGEREIGYDPSIEAAEGVRLTGKNLETAFMENKFQINIPMNLIEGGDQSYIIQFKKDHTITFSSKDGSNIMGKWSTTDNRCCVEMKHATGCYSVIKDNQCIKLYDLTDTLFSTIRLY